MKGGAAGFNEIDGGDDLNILRWFVDVCVRTL